MSTGSFLPPERFNLSDYLLTARLREGLGDRFALHLENRSLTYREVAELAARFGHLMLGLGVRQEERVMIALPDSPEFVGALFGAIQMGAVAMMIGPDLGPEHLAAIAQYSRARLAVVHTDQLATFESALAGAERRPGLLQVGGVRGIHPVFEEEAEQLPTQLPTAATHRDDPALWLFSGGTTGAPKAVVQTHRSYANTTELYAKRTLGYRLDDITLSVPKLYFGYATGANLFFPFSVGAGAVLFPERPTPEVLYEKIERHRPTILINVPSMINSMVSHPEAGRHDLSSLRFATSAGEPLPESLYHRWKEVFGVELLDGLGTAEMWHIFITNRPGEVRPGTLGRVVVGFEVRACDDEGHPVPPGEAGLLWVRGGSRALGYWQNLERTQEVFRGEWVVTGDLISIDEDGFVTHRGRADDAVKVKGKWLRPQEVESCLLEHPAVKECAVVGVEDEAGLLKPVAFVVPATAATDDLEEQLRAHVLDRLQPYKHPRKVIFLQALPTTHLGKVDRARLRQQADAR